VVTHTSWLISTVTTLLCGQTIVRTISLTLQGVHAVRHHYCFKLALLRLKEPNYWAPTVINPLVATIPQVTFTKAQSPWVKIHRRYSQFMLLTLFNLMNWCTTRMGRTEFWVLDLHHPSGKPLLHHLVWTQFNTQLLLHASIASLCKMAQNKFRATLQSVVILTLSTTMEELIIRWLLKHYNRHSLTT